MNNSLFPAKKLFFDETPNSPNTPTNQPIILIEQNIPVKTNIVESPDKDDFPARKLSFDETPNSPNTPTKQPIILTEQNTPIKTNIVESPDKDDLSARKSSNSLGDKYNSLTNDINPVPQLNLIM